MNHRDVLPIKIKCISIAPGGETEYHFPGVLLEHPQIFDTSELIYLEVDNNQKCAFQEAGLLPL